MSIIQIPDYPSNKFTTRTNTQEQKKKIEKVIKGDATKQKKSVSKKVEDFLKNDGRDIIMHILEKKIIPSIKNLVYDVFTGGISMLLYKDDKGNGSTSFFNNQNRINYGSFFYSNKQSTTNHNITRSNATINTVDDIVISNKTDAELVLSQLVELIDMYGFAAVSDYYELLGFVGAHTDEKYGWNDLSTASVKRVQNGWTISLPRVTPIG